MTAPTTLHEDVYKRLKTMIVRRELEPGSKLVLRVLAKRLGTSATPVLEAVRRLERDGLVTQIPKWGAFVKKWSPLERLEAVHIRRALEGEAARLFVLRANQAAKDELVTLGKRFDEAAVVDPIACDDVDIALHVHIAWSTGFDRLGQLIETSKVETATVLGNFLDEKLPDYRSKVGIHDALIEALLGTDPEAAMRLMWQHIDQFFRVLRNQPDADELSAVKAVPMAEHRSS